MEGPTTAILQEDIEEAPPLGTEMASGCKEKVGRLALRKIPLQDVRHCTTRGRAVEGIVAVTEVK